jgi:hypothetical protein
MPVFPRFAYRSYAAVKHQVDLLDRWPRWQRIRRGFQAPFYRIADTGWFGLSPLKMHVLICGFPAAGTTLLQLMLENGLPDARRFGKERSGWRAATYSLRNHELMISKQPHDLFRLDPLRSFYAGRKAELRVILMLRDPRDLLTSQRPRGNSLEYCGACEDWRTYYHAFLRQWHRSDTLVIRYEDLVEQAESQQTRVEAFVGRSMAVAFTDFPLVDREDFDTSTLCGLRPLDPTRISRWRDPAHYTRIQQILRQLPELPSALQKLGYEQDSSWIQPYLQTSAVSGLALS